MRFLVMHKVDGNMEAGGPPSPAIIENMGALVQGSLKSGVFLNGAGLHRSARRVRLKADGSVESGPYAGERELCASLTMVSAPSVDAAVAAARELSQSLGGIEVEVGPVVEPWDLGMMPKPERPTAERFLLLCKASSDDETTDTSKRHAAAVKSLSSSLKSGAILAHESLASSREGKRAAKTAGKRLWLDGPFAESKELIAGFSLLSLPSWEEALAWADRYAAILSDSEVEVRRVHEP